MKNMKILIIGPTGAGKSTIAQKICDHTYFKKYSMSKMFRDTYTQDDETSLTEYSKKLLSENKNVNIEYIEKLFGTKIKYIDGFIFEGFRNPSEFIQFIDENTIVIVLKPSFINYKDNFEEFGIKSCENIAYWNNENKSIKNVFIFNYDNFLELDDKITKFLASESRYL
jgi:DNA-dependent RNA polymerase auxiliary subunit epsilon